MPRLFATGASLAFAVLLAVPAEAAAPCYTTSVTDDREIVFELPVQEEVVGVHWMVNYVAVDTFCMVGVGDGTCSFSIWFYPEGNGLPGLQRGDEVKSDVENCTDGTISDAGGLW
jgi:hypothetical protein